MLTSGMPFMTLEDSTESPLVSCTIPSTAFTPGVVVKLSVLLLMVRLLPDCMATMPMSLLLTVLP